MDFGNQVGPKLGRKIDPRGTKIEVQMEVKFDRFLKASWNANFSAKMRPRGAADAPGWRGGTKAKVQGEDKEGV